MGQTFVYNSGEADVATDELHLSFGLFFDGTLNNKEHTRIRKRIQKEKTEKAVEKTEKEIFEDELYIKHGGKSTDNNSFQNDYTNVARMQMECTEDYAIYIEGIGTVGMPDKIENLDTKEREKLIKKLGDVKPGYAMGSGFTGIRGKVRKGCEQLAEAIKNIKKNKSGNDISLKTITLDVFGFSRGAAAARNFVYEVNATSKRPKDIEIKNKKVFSHNEQHKSVPTQNNDFNTFKTIAIYKDAFYDRDEKEVDPLFLADGKLPKFGYLGYLLLKNEILNKEELNNLDITIRFIGVYDTVSSYEEVNDSESLFILTALTHLMKNQFQDDVEQLQLNNLGYFQKAIHFTAMDEHRENFDLTRMCIKNLVAMPNALEFNLPGVHCDIGGAYETGKEIVKEIETVSHSLNLKKRRQQLIDEHWYNESQIKSNALQIYGERYIHKEYSYIPLHFMETFFKNELSENDISKIFLENLEYKYPILRIRTVPDYMDNLLNSFPDFGSPNDYGILNSYKKGIKMIEIPDNTLIDAKHRLNEYVFNNGEEWLFISDDDIMKEKEEDAKRAERYDLINVNSEKENTENTEKMEEIVLEEIIIPPYNEQILLRALRNNFLHWSATRASFGMDPRDDYKRVEH